MYSLERQLTANKEKFEHLSSKEYSEPLKQSIVMLGGTYRALGLWDEAIKIFDLGLALSEKEGLEESISEFYIWKSNVNYHSCHYGRAIELAAKALSYKMPVTAKAGRISYYLGRPYLLLGDLHKYIDLQYEAIELIKDLDDKIKDMDMPWFLSDLANGLQLIGDINSAYKIIGEQVKKFKSMNQVHGTPYSLVILGNISLKLNKLDESRAALDEALALYEVLKRESFIVDILVELSKVELSVGEVTKAKQYIDNAIAEARKGPRESEGLADKRHLNNALVHGSRLYFYIGETAEATKLYTEAMGLAVEANRKMMIKELLELDI